MSSFKHPSSCVDEGAYIGEGTAIWHFSHVREGARIGRDCRLGQNVYIDGGVRIGDRCKIQNNVSIYSGVTLEDEVFVGPSAVFTNDRVPRATGDWQIVPTLVCRGASIGANATVRCGVRIGQFALVGAGAVVVDDVPAHAVVIGNPARAVGYVCRCGRLRAQAFEEVRACSCMADGGEGRG